MIEVALAFILLSGGGLLVRSFFQMMRVELGFDATNVLTMRLPIAGDRFATARQLHGVRAAGGGRVAAVPGVSGAAAADALPLEGYGNGMPFLIAGRGGRRSREPPGLPDSRWCKPTTSACSAFRSSRAAASPIGTSRARRRSP